jgi:nucleotide-binding universal stress UspA family protein
MFKHILLPTDGSPLSEAAVEEGLLFANAVDAKITGFCVIPLHYKFRYTARIMQDAFGQSTEPDTALEKAFQAMVEKGTKEGKKLVEDYLATMIKSAKEAGVDCDAFYDMNDFPYEAIIHTAGKKGCDLIMMASHGRSGAKALLLGSETQKVLTHSRIPVLVHRKGPEKQKGSGIFQRILLPTDASELSDAAAARGIEFAKALHARVTGIFVVPEHYPSYFHTGATPELKKQAEEEWRAYAQKHLSQLAAAAEAKGVACDGVVAVADDPYEAVVDVAGKKNCDLILMASHGRKGFGAVLLGSVTQKVLIHSKIPVLVYR